MKVITKVHPHDKMPEGVCGFVDTGEERHPEMGDAEREKESRR